MASLRTTVILCYFIACVGAAHDPCESTKPKPVVPLKPCTTTMPLLEKIGIGVAAGIGAAAVLGGSIGGAMAGRHHKSPTPTPSPSPTPTTTTTPQFLFAARIHHKIITPVEPTQPPSDQADLEENYLRFAAGGAGLLALGAIGFTAAYMFSSAGTAASMRGASMLGVAPTAQSRDLALVAPMAAQEEGVGFPTGAAAWGVPWVSSMPRQMPATSFVQSMPGMSYVPQYNPVIPGASSMMISQPYAAAVPIYAETGVPLMM